jgi:hypothetical protein
MQKYGLILADAGRPWFLTGEASAGWETLLGANLTAFRNDIASIKAVNMEVVQPEGGHSSEIQKTSGCSQLCEAWHGCVWLGMVQCRDIFWSCLFLLHSCLVPAFSLFCIVFFT